MHIFFSFFTNILVFFYFNLASLLLSVVWPSVLFHHLPFLLVLLSSAVLSNYSTLHLHWQCLGLEFVWTVAKCKVKPQKHLQIYFHNFSLNNEGPQLLTKQFISQMSNYFWAGSNEVTVRMDIIIRSLIHFPLTLTNAINLEWPISLIPVVSEFP